MQHFLEPLFLNEKMMLNTAAYLFKGVTLEEEVTENTEQAKKGKGSLGFTFLQSLISPIALEGEINKSNSQSLKSARTYTLGGLHMTVVEELLKKEQLKAVTLNPLNVPTDTFVSLDVILKPVDFYQILEVLELVRPLIAQVLTDFGEKFSKEAFTNKTLKEIPKYDKLVESVISSLEKDYLQSKQLEMLMVSPLDNKIIGIVDIDLTDLEPQEIKAKLNDGKFHVIGKVSRYIEDGETMSMVQRTVLSKIVELVSSGMSLDLKNISGYQAGLSALQPVIEKFVKLSVPGPVVRVVAMSVSV